MSRLTLGIANSMF